MSDAALTEATIGLPATSEADLPATPDTGLTDA